MQAGLRWQARQRLVRLSEQRPDEAGVALQLGRCELACDHPDEALVAWTRVSETSTLAPLAALEQANLTIRLGRFSEAEQVLTRALSRPRTDATDLRRLLVRPFGQEGRFDDARHVIETQRDDLDRSLPDSRDVRLALLREHIELDFDPVPLEGNIAQIQARANEDDDRFLIARAYIATRAGRFDEAENELEVCFQHRLDDPVVWRAWLDWAVAFGQSGPAREAMSHVPALSSEAVRVQKLRAWLALRRGDPLAERRALEQLVTLDPSGPRLHFGLGSSPKVESIEVRWPSGRFDRYENLAADTGYHLREGDLRPKQLRGFRASVRW
jgi:enediyne biosynthesis protein E4